MTRDGDVVLLRLRRRQSEMGTGLAGNLVTELAKGLRQFVAGQIARKFHNANTSSRT